MTYLSIFVFEQCASAPAIPASPYQHVVVDFAPGALGARRHGRAAGGACLARPPCAPSQAFDRLAAVPAVDKPTDNIDHGIAVWMGIPDSHSASS